MTTTENTTNSAAETQAAPRSTTLSRAKEWLEQHFGCQIVLERRERSGNTYDAYTYGADGHDHVGYVAGLPGSNRHYSVQII